MDSKKSCFHLKLSVFGNFLVKLIENSKEIGNFWDMQQMVRCLHIYYVKTTNAAKLRTVPACTRRRRFFLAILLRENIKSLPPPHFETECFLLKLNFETSRESCRSSTRCWFFFSNFYIEKISRDPPVRDQLTKCFHIIIFLYCLIILVLYCF